VAAAAAAPFSARARTPHTAATAALYRTPVTAAAAELDDFDDSPLLSLEAMGLSAASLAAISVADQKTQPHQDTAQVSFLGRR
jgi:hypothetical protein